MDIKEAICLLLMLCMFDIGAFSQDSNSLDDVKEKGKFDPLPELFSQDLNSEYDILLEHPASVFEYDEYLESSEVWKELEYTSTESLPVSSNIADSTAMFLPNMPSVDDLPYSDFISTVEGSVVTTPSSMALEIMEVAIMPKSLISSVLLEPSSSVSVETNAMVDMIMSEIESSVPGNTQFEMDSSQTIPSSSTFSDHVSLDTSYLDNSVQPLVKPSTDGHMAFSMSQSVICSEVKVTSQPITQEADILTTNISLVTKVSMLSNIVQSTPMVVDEKFDSFATESSFLESIPPGQEYSFNSTITKVTSSQYFVDRMMTSMIIFPSISVSYFPINVSSSSYGDFLAFPSSVDYSMTSETWTDKMESYDESASSLVIFYSDLDSAAYLNTDSTSIQDVLSSPNLESSTRSFPHSKSILSLVATDTTKIEATTSASQSDNFHTVILSSASVTKSDIFQQEFSTGHLRPDESTSRIAETNYLSESYDFQIDITAAMSEDYASPVEISPSHSFIDESIFDITPWWTESDFFQSELTEMTSLFDESIFYTVLTESSSLIFSEMTSTIASSPVLQVMSTQRISIDATVLVKPVVKKDITVMIVFDGDCSILTGPNTANHNALTTFSLSFKLQLESILYLSSDSVTINEITCGSVHVLVTITNATDALSENQLRQIIVDQKFIVSVNYSGIIENFTAVEVEIIQNGTQTTPTPMPGGIDDIDVIVIIVACCICAVLLVLGVIICIKQWYRKTRAQSFDLIDTPHVNLKMEDFTLTRIPRPRAIYNEGGAAMIHSYTGESNGHPHRKANGHQSTPSEAETVQLNDISIEDKSPQSVAKSNVSSTPGSNRTHPRESIASSGSSMQANDLTYSRSSEALVPHSDISAHGSVNPIYNADDESATLFVSDSDNATKDDSSQ